MTLKDDQPIMMTESSTHGAHAASDSASVSGGVTAITGPSEDAAMAFPDNGAVA